MSNSFFSLENNPKRGPYDDIFYFVAGLNHPVLLLIHLFITSSPMTKIIQPHKIEVFAFMGISGPRQPYQHSAQTHLVVVCVCVVILIFDAYVVLPLSWFLPL